MNRERVIELYNEYADAGNRVNAYYVTYRETDNITSQIWGRMGGVEELASVLDRIGKSHVCIQGELPFVRMMFYSDDSCLAIFENPLWDCVNDESGDSHVVMTVPFIARNGCFGSIMEWVENRFRIRNEDIAGSIEGFPIGVVVKMLECQYEQNGKDDLSVFVSDRNSDRKHGGVDWERTPDGHVFWDGVINGLKFRDFFLKYPEYGRYNIKCDCVPDMT